MGSLGEKPMGARTSEEQAHAPGTGHRKGEALTGVHPDTALLAGNKDAGAILLEVRSGKVDVRATASRGEAHFWNQWLGPLLLGGYIWSIRTVLTEASKLNLRREREHTSVNMPALWASTCSISRKLAPSLV